MIPFVTFFFVMVVTAILFGSWVVVSIFKMIWRGITGGPRPMVYSMGGRPCMNPGCRIGNPMHANYCRRCGSNLKEPAFSPQKPQPSPRFNPANGRERQVAQI